MATSADESTPLMVNTAPPRRRLSQDERDSVHHQQGRFEQITPKPEGEFKHVDASRRPGGVGCLPNDQGVDELISALSKTHSWSDEETEFVLSELRKQHLDTVWQLRRVDFDDEWKRMNIALGHQFAIQGAIREAGNDIREVGMAAQVFRISKILDADSEFTAYFSLHPTWIEPSLVNSEDVDDEDDDWTPPWVPGIQFHNDNEVEIMREVYNIVDTKTGLVEGSLTCRGSFYELMELNHFPFDRQLLRIIVTSKYSTDRVVLCRSPLRKNIFFSFDLPEWVVNDPDNLKVEFSHQTSSSGNMYPSFILYFEVERRYRYFFWNVMLVVALLVVLNLACFFLPHDDLSDRISITLTIVLTAVAFKFVVSEGLPRISYLTLLDKYVILGFVMLCGIGLENIAVLMMPHTVAQKVDDYCLYFIACFWALLHVGIMFATSTGAMFSSWDSVYADNGTELKSLIVANKEGERNVSGFDAMSKKLM